MILLGVISEEQSVFVLGRLINDNVIMAYECLYFMKANRSKKSSQCALKLDMMKAYDHLEWDYLESITKKLGFAPSSVDTMMGGRSISFSVLFNGARTENFKPTRGLRQVNPISPSLFLLAGEGLSCLLKQAMSSGALTGMQVANTARRVNHLLFVADCILFCKVEFNDDANMREVLDAYGSASGQRINNEQSSVFFGK
jgi:mannosylglycoprotein endo-beta-mannosidase